MGRKQDVPLIFTVCFLVPYLRLLLGLFFFSAVLFIHSEDGEEWSKYLQEMLFTNYKIASHNTEYKNVCETHFDKYLIKVILLTPSMAKEDRVRATLKYDTLSLYILLHCSVEVEQFLSRNANINIVSSKEIEESENTVREVLHEIIIQHECYFGQYDIIDESEIPVQFFPENFYPVSIENIEASWHSV